MTFVRARIAALFFLAALSYSSIVFARTQTDADDEDAIADSELTLAYNAAVDATTSQLAAKNSQSNVKPPKPGWDTPTRTTYNNLQATAAGDMMLASNKYNQAAGYVSTAGEDMDLGDGMYDQEFWDAAYDDYENAANAYSNACSTYNSSKTWYDIAKSDWDAVNSFWASH